MSSWLGLVFRGTKSGESTGPLPIEGLEDESVLRPRLVSICQGTSARKIDISRVSVSRIIVRNARVFEVGRVIVREARVLSLFRKIFLRLGMSVLEARAAVTHNARLLRRGK